MASIVAQVGAGGVDHHRRVDAVERALLGHEDLAAAALLGRRAEDDDPAAELVGERGGGQPGAEPGGADDVVPAGVADAGQGVVLAQHGDRRARRRRPGAAKAVSRPKAPRSTSRPSSSSRSVSRSWAKCSSKPSSGCAWIWCEASSSTSARRSTSSASRSLAHRGPCARLRQHCGRRSVDAQTTTARASGSTRTTSVGAAPDVARRRARRRAAGRSRAGRRPPGARCDAGVRHVGAGGQPAAGLQPVAERQVAVDDVEQAVAGWARGATSHSPEPLGVHRRHDPAAPPRPAGDEVGDEPVQPPVDERPTPRSTGQVDGLVRMRRRPSSPRPPSVRQRSPPRSPSGGIGSLARRAASTTARASASARTTTPSSGSGPGLAPRLALARSSRPPALPTVRRGRSSTTDRRHLGQRLVVVADARRGGDHAAEQGARPPRAAASPGRGSGAASPIWRSRSMSCFTLRTKSPPESVLVVEDVVEVVARGPRVGQRDEAGIGRRVSGSPAPPRRR